MIQKNHEKKALDDSFFSKRWDSNPRTIDTAPNFSIIDTRRVPVALNHSASHLLLVFIFNEINNSLRTVGFEPTHQR